MTANTISISVLTWWVISAMAMYLPVHGIAVAPSDVNLFRTNGLMLDSDHVISNWRLQARKRRSAILTDSENVVENAEEKETQQLLSDGFEKLDGTFPQKHENCTRKGMLTSIDVSNLTSSKLFEYPELQRSIDIEADPCDNFYDFVCAGFLKENIIRDDQESVSQFGLLTEKTKNQFEELFDNRELMKEIAPYDKLMYHIYDSCMNETARRRDGSRILIERLRALWNMKHEFLTDWMIDAFPAGAFYVVGIMPDFRQPHKQLLMISQSSLILQSEKLYIEDSHHTVMKAYRELLRGILTILSNDSKEAAANSENVLDEVATLPFPLEPDDIEKRIDALLDFETKWAAMINATDKRYDDIYSLVEYTTVAEFQQNIISSVNWERLLKGILPDPVLSNLTVTNKAIGELEVIVCDLPNLVKYEQLVRSLTPEQIQFYLDWKTIFLFTDDLDDRYGDIYLAFNSVVSGSKVAPSKNETCRISARSVVSNSIRRLYLREHYNEAIVPIVKDINENIDAAFRQMLHNNTWMDDTTRSYALEKISKMNHIIGVSKDDSTTELYCEKLDVDTMLNSNFAEAQAIYTRWTNRQVLCALLQPTNTLFDATVVNAMSLLLMNAVAIPSGILRGVFFDANRSAALNYGAIGTILGHEMIHGFDNNGRQHDASGAVRDWWNKETERNFIEHKRCLIEQYSNLNLTNTTLHVDGELTQGENVADNGGMRAAFLAFEKYLAQSADKEQLRIKGLEQFDARQQFFLSYAFSWCGADRPESRILTLLMDTHAPRDIRVNVVLANTQEFADAFQCPVDSPMNPTKKCVLW